MKPIHPSDCFQKSIVKIIDTDERKEYKCVPFTVSVNDIFTFEFISGNRKWLILDPYGDDIMPSEMKKRLLHIDPEFGYAIAIGLDPSNIGNIFQVTFLSEKNNVILYLSDIEYRIPIKYAKMFDQLKSEKRPFKYSVNSHSLMNFLDQEIGYRDLENEMIISLSFNNFNLELAKYSHREVSSWR